MYTLKLVIQRRIYCIYKVENELVLIHSKEISKCEAVVLVNLL